MRIYTSIAGSYPRIGENFGKELRRVLHDYDRGETTIEQVWAEQEKVIRIIVKEQEDAGIDFITDGLVRWYDPVSHIAGRLKGVTVGPLHHYFSTNFHVRKVVVRTIPEWDKALISEEIKFLRSITDRSILAILPSAELLMKYTQNGSSYSDQEILDAYRRALNFEAFMVKQPVYWLNGKNDKWRVIKAVKTYTAKEEDPKVRAQQIAQELEGETRDVILIPSWELDILPHNYAKRKMELLTQIKEELCLLLP